jgi:hypothetical protein
LVLFSGGRFTGYLVQAEIGNYRDCGKIFCGLSGHVADGSQFEALPLRPYVGIVWRFSVRNNEFTLQDTIK